MILIWSALVEAFSSVVTTLVCIIDEGQLRVIDSVSPSGNSPLEDDLTSQLVPSSGLDGACTNKRFEILSTVVDRCDPLTLAQVMWKCLAST